MTDLQNSVEINGVKNKIQRYLEKPIARSILPVIGLVVVLVIFTMLTGGKIISPINITLLLDEVYVLMIASIGVFFIMTMGCLDFSQGSILGIASIVFSYLSGFNILLAIVGAIIAGAIIGAINGFFHVKRKIPSFIVTICTMFLFRGLIAYLTTNSPVYAISDILNYNTVTVKLISTVAILLIAFLVFHFTKLGIYLKAIGAGEIGSRFAGVDVDKIKWIMYIVAGMITGFAAFINVVEVGSVTASGGSMFETEILIALVLGGLPITGGVMARFSNIITGVLTYKVLSAGLNMIGLTTQTQQLIEGVIFLLVVALFSDRKSLHIIK
ncbi:ABC-type transporter, integral membrane subunit [Thermoanaerobacterium xylanolyticum LX-11]|uniref:ABC-type transporter, integral membrane subunit n=1 Tax=Thermoanaerobacterium xylanolyticum (strain ATCC 49914 / DSM 7097 / LX-11) TaxID=858215 RepID=F6BHT5_THEXL|nr:ABC transporter permease [Thermoanaerobacterium xylanolyticum]AEF16604.1 ABC-type transporter, integral membrane subunit [Thermoanaerobacterium xylanolyticum LX-11]